MGWFFFAVGLLLVLAVPGLGWVLVAVWPILFAAGIVAAFVVVLALIAKDLLIR
jgi:hypothetical protein